MEIPKLSKRLEILEMSSNHLEALDESFSDFPRLTTIQLTCNSIRKVHENAFTNCENLIQVDLSINSLTEFPEGLVKASSIEWLDLSYNQIENLPEAIKNMNLSSLYASNNKLNSQSLENICGIKNLQSLNLNSNYLQDLTDKFENLKFLQNLWLAENRFIEFPDVISKLRFMANVKNIEYFIILQKKIIKLL